MTDTKAKKETSSKKIVTEKKSCGCGCGQKKAKQ